MKRRQSTRKPSTPCAPWPAGRVMPLGDCWAHDLNLSGARSLSLEPFAQQYGLKGFSESDMLTLCAEAFALDSQARETPRQGTVCAMGHDGAVAPALAFSCFFLLGAQADGAPSDLIVQEGAKAALVPALLDVASDLQAVLSWISLRAGSLAAVLVYQREAHRILL